MNDNWPDGPPHPSTIGYIVYRMAGGALRPIASDRVVTEDEVSARFMNRYGHAPDWLVEWQRHLWVGPPPRENHERE